MRKVDDYRGVKESLEGAERVSEDDGFSYDGGFDVLESEHNS